MSRGVIWCGTTSFQVSFLCWYWHLKLHFVGMFGVFMFFSGHSLLGDPFTNTKSVYFTTQIHSEHCLPSLLFGWWLLILGSWEGTPRLSSHKHTACSWNIKKTSHLHCLPSLLFGWWLLIWGSSEGTPRLSTHKHTACSWNIKKTSHFPLSKWFPQITVFQQSSPALCTERAHTFILGSG